MRRTVPKTLAFLVVLSLAVVTAAVLAPSAMTKKQPPAAPSGVFIVQPFGAIALSGMTLTSTDQVVVAACWWTPNGQFVNCAILGDNSAAATPGEQVVIPDQTIEDFTGMGSSTTVPLTVRLILLDETTETVYTSDTSESSAAFPGGTMSVPGHATLGWADAQVLVSINDGSQNPTSESKPDLGAGNFNATVAVTAPEWPVSITNITGYSDGPFVDQNNNTWCLFHAVITYEGKSRKKLNATAMSSFLQAYSANSAMSWVQTTLGESPYDPGTLTLNPADLVARDDYQFGAQIQDSAYNTLGIQFTSLFTLDPTTFVDGCPVPGQLVSTDYGT